MDKTDVTARYIKPSAGHLTNAAQRVADFLDERLQSTDPPLITQLQDHGAKTGCSR